MNDVAATLGLGEYLARKPHALSGGQRQRVALGRAIVRDPKVFLFDEPLSNLDAALRVGTRGELVRLHQRLGATMIYVTHDQVEAMTMGDRICIMNRGRVVQTGAPLEVYSQPADTFVASFLGSPPANLLAARIDGESIVLGDTRLPLAGALATVARSAPSREVIVGIRPEDIGFGGSDAQVQADVLAVEQLGAETILRLQLPGVIDEVLMRAGRQVDVRSGTRVALSFDLAATHLFDPASTRRIAAD